MLKSVEQIGQEYKKLIEINEDKKIEVDVDESLTEGLNNLKSAIELNTDLEDMQTIIELKDLAENYYNEIANSQDYIKQFNYITSKYIKDYAITLLREKVMEYIEENPIEVQYSKSTEEPTNEDITVTLLIGEDTTITNNDGSNQHTFTQNDTFVFEYSRRGIADKIEITINNIDKDPPKILGVSDGKSYVGWLVPRIEDKNEIKTVEMYYNGELQKDFKIGQTIKSVGEYKLVAEDILGNRAEIQFQIKEVRKPITPPSTNPDDSSTPPTEDKEKWFETDTYNIENNTIRKINENTIYEEFRKEINTNLDYEIKRNGDLIAEEDAIATGDILTIKSTNKSYTLIVTGDINKDGKVGITDLVRIRRVLLEEITLDEIESLAADANLDNNKIGIADLVRIRKMILEIKD